MKSIDSDIIIQLENFIVPYGYEFQAIGKEIKLYLLDSGEIHIIVDQVIEIYAYNVNGCNDKYSTENLIEAKAILQSILTS